MNTSVSWHGPGCVVANQCFSGRMHVTLGQALQPGGRIVLAARHFSDMGDPQMRSPGAENYVRVSSSRPQASWRLCAPEDMKRHPWNRGICVELTARQALPEGSKVAIALGPSEAGSPGYRCQSFAEEKFHLRVGIDFTGRGDWQLMDTQDSPGFRVVGAPPGGARVYAPRPTSPHGPLRICIKPEDAHGNVSGYRMGTVQLLLDDTESLGEVDVEAGEPTVVDLPRPRDRSWHRVTVADDQGAVWARSNPVGTSPVPGHELYFGDIHCQSGLCDGTGSPARLYEYARYVAGLDFCSVTSHDMELTEEDWEDIQQATWMANAPGRFVTLSGYEWSGRYGHGGDHNIYFPGDGGPLVANGPVGGYEAWDPARGEHTETRDLAETIAMLRDYEPMIIPHVGGRCCNFDYYDPERMPLLEMHSCHRNHEHVALEALRRGLRLGFIGGSDDHRGAPGDSVPAARDRYFSTRTGLVAVYAEELTREALWEAFFARRTYATNGARMVVDFRVNDTLMGGELTAEPGQTLKFRMWSRVDGLLDRMELVRSDGTAERFVRPENQVPEAEFTHEEPAPAEPTAYYLRVTQNDGGTAWTSPVWVTPAAD